MRGRTRSSPLPLGARRANPVERQRLLGVRAAAQSCSASVCVSGRPPPPLDPPTARRSVGPQHAGTSARGNIRAPSGSAQVDTPPHERSDLSSDALSSARASPQQLINEVIYSRGRGLRVWSSLIGRNWSRLAEPTEETFNYFNYLINNKKEALSNQPTS